MILSMEEIQHVATILIVLQLFGWMQHVMEKKTPPAKKKGYPSSHNHGSVENWCISNFSFLSFISTSMIIGGR